MKRFHPPCALAIVGLLLSAFAAKAHAIEADALYFGGPIVTVDDTQPIAEAIAVKGGRIAPEFR